MELELCSGLNDLQIKHTELFGFELFNFVLFGSRKAMLWFQGYSRLRHLTRKKETVQAKALSCLNNCLNCKASGLRFLYIRVTLFFWQIKLDGLSLLQVYQEHVGSQSLLSFELTVSY